MINRPVLMVPTLALMAAGCVGTPHLLDAAKEGSEQPSPSIDDVKTEITCELIKFKNEERLKHLKDPTGALFQNSYLITATLTLQVDDYLDLTPTLNFIHPIAAAASDMRTVIASADIGGQRERTYTETFYLDSTKLDRPEDADSLTKYLAKHCDSDKYFRGNKYSLRGDLKLDEIIENGEKSLLSTGAYSPKPSSSANPSFGSTVEFIVTRNLTGLGVQWALVHFKGPSATNGLINGKKVTTDKLVIAFAQTVPPTQSDNSKLTDAIEKLALAINANANAKQQLAAAGEAKHFADQKAAALEAPYQAQLRLQPRARPRPELNQARAEAGRRQAELAGAQRTSAATSLAVDIARDNLTSASAATVATTSSKNEIDSAAQANQLLQQTMILQSLNIQPH